MSGTLIYIGFESISAQPCRLGKPKPSILSQAVQYRQILGFAKKKMIKMYTNILSKIDRFWGSKMVQKWNPIFFHIQGEQIFVKSASDRSWTEFIHHRTFHFPLLAGLKTLLDRFQFFFAPLWAPLGPVRAPSRSPRRPPRSILESIFQSFL